MGEWKDCHMRYLTVSLLFVASPRAAWGAETVGKKTYQVPYRLTATNHVLVRAKINGKGPFNFILDTGAPALFVATSVCQKLGVKADRQGWGSFDRFEIEGGVKIEHARGRVEDPFQLEGMNGLGLAGAELHGIIGYTVLAQFQLEFDFTRHKMGWLPLDYRPPPPEGLGGRSSPTGMDALGGVMKLLGALLGKSAAPRVVLRGFLGIVLSDAAGQVSVKSVLPESPAQAAGLQAGDRIIAVQGKPVRQSADVFRRVAPLGPGEQVRLRVTRDGRALPIVLRTGQGL